MLKVWQKLIIKPVVGLIVGKASNEFQRGGFLPPIVTEEDKLNKHEKTPHFSEERDLLWVWLVSAIVTYGRANARFMETLIIKFDVKDIHN